MNAIAAAAIGLILAHLDKSLVPMLVGPLQSVPPGYQCEIWLANALLSVYVPVPRSITACSSVTLYRPLARGKQ